MLSHTTGVSRGHISTNTRNHHTTSNRANGNKHSHVNGTNSSNRYQNSGSYDMDAGISFISPAIPPEIPGQDNFFANSSNVCRGTFDFRSSSAISNSTSSSSGGSFISGLRDPSSSTAEKHLRFIDMARNESKSNNGVSISQNNTDLLDREKVRNIHYNVTLLLKCTFLFSL